MIKISGVIIGVLYSWNLYIIYKFTKN